MHVLTLEVKIFKYAFIYVVDDTRLNLRGLLTCFNTKVFITMRIVKSILCNVVVETWENNMFQ